MPVPELEIKVRRAQRGYVPEPVREGAGGVIHAVRGVWTASAYFLPTPFTPTDLAATVREIIDAEP